MRSAGREHGSHLATAEDVDVEMRDFLVAMGAHVGQDAVAWFFEAELFGDAADRGEEARDLRGCGSGREIRQGDVGRFGDDQDVDGGLGVDIVEGESEFVFVDAVGGEFAAEDAGEDVTGVVGSEAGDGHGGFLVIRRDKEASSAFAEPFAWIVLCTPFP
jgi:hypothetical protein